MSEKQPFIHINQSYTIPVSAYKNDIQTISYEIIDEIITNCLHSYSCKPASSPISSNQVLFDQKTLSEAQIKHIKCIFMDFNEQINIAKSKEEKISKLEIGISSIGKVLFGEEEEHLRGLRDFLKELRVGGFEEEKTNLINIDLSESIKKRREKKQNRALKENQKPDNSAVLERNEGEEESPKKIKRKALKLIEIGEEQEGDYEIHKDGENVTNRKRKARNEIKKTTTGKKVKRDMLREMKEFTRITQNSIEYDIFF